MKFLNTIHDASMISTDNEHQFVTDVQMTKWDSNTTPDNIVLADDDLIAEGIQNNADTLEGHPANYFATATQINNLDGFSAVQTIFNADGSITETRADESTLVTVFNADGSITETLTKNSVVKVKTTTFNADGQSISEVLS